MQGKPARKLAAIGVLSAAFIQLNVRLVPSTEAGAFLVRGLLPFDGKEPSMVCGLKMRTGRIALGLACAAALTASAFLGRLVPAHGAARAARHQGAGAAATSTPYQSSVSFNGSGQKAAEAIPIPFGKTVLIRQISVQASMPNGTLMDVFVTTDPLPGPGRSIDVLVVADVPATRGGAGVSRLTHLYAVGSSRIVLEFDRQVRTHATVQFTGEILEP
jgi:hypothetical protein